MAGMSVVIDILLIPNRSIVVVSAIHRSCELWRDNLRCSANLFLISSIRLFIALSPPPFNSAACSLVQELCQRQRAQACLFEGFIFPRRSGFIEEDE